MRDYKMSQYEGREICIVLKLAKENAEAMCQCIYLVMSEVALNLEDLPF